MLNHYQFEKCQLMCGRHKMISATTNIAIDIQDDDKYGDRLTGHYRNGFACEGQLTFEWPASVPLYFKKHEEAVFVILDHEGDSTRLKIVMMEQVDSSPGIPGALPNHPCRTRHLTWSYCCLQRPLSDNLGLFPEVVVQRNTMRVFVFHHFPGYWNSRQTTAVVTASTRQDALEMLKEELREKGIAHLKEGMYSLIEIDPTTPSVSVIMDGSDN